MLILPDNKTVIHVWRKTEVCSRRMNVSRGFVDMQTCWGGCGGAHRWGSRCAAASAGSAAVASPGRWEAASFGPLVEWLHSPFSAAAYQACSYRDGKTQTPAWISSPEEGRGRGAFYRKCDTESKSFAARPGDSFRAKKRQKKFVSGSLTGERASLRMFCYLCKKTAPRGFARRGPLTSYSRDCRPSCQRCSVHSAKYANNTWTFDTVHRNIVNLLELYL